MNNDVQVIKSEVAPVVDQAASMVVNSAESYGSAGDFLKRVKQAQGRVTAFFAPMKQKAYEAHRAITAQESETLKPLHQAEATVKRVMAEYYQTQERIRIAEQQKAQAAADEAARKERERLEREAAKIKTPELRESRMERAAAVVAPMIQVATAVPVIAGQSVRKTWKAVVVNAAIVPREWFVINDSALQAFARSTKGAVKVAGVEFVEEVCISSSSR